MAESPPVLRTVVRVKASKYLVETTFGPYMPNGRTTQVLPVLMFGHVDECNPLLCWHDRHDDVVEKVKRIGTICLFCNADVSAGGLLCPKCGTVVDRPKPTLWERTFGRLLRSVGKLVRRTKK